MSKPSLPKLSNSIISKYNIDTNSLQGYNQPKLTQKVGKSGGIGCFTENMNIALTVRAGSSSPPNSERYSKKIMWNDFSSLAVWIRVCSYSQKMNGKNRRAASVLFPSPVVKRESSTGSIFRALVKSLATVRGAF